MNEDNDQTPDRNSGNKPITGKHKRDIERTLATILESEQFAASPQLGDFLSFIVTKSLAGETKDIKAYTIAVDALGRGEDFDPQTNAAVRVAAGRLRQALALYQTDAASQNNPLRIELAPGSYVPAFVEQTPVDALPENQIVEKVEDGAIATASAAAVQRSAEQDNLISMSDPDMERSVLELVDKFEDEKTLPRRRSALKLAALTIAGIGLIGAIAYATLPTFQQRLAVLWGSNDASTQRSAQAPATSIPILKDIRPRIKLSVLFPDKQYPDWFKLGEITDSIVLAISRFDDFEFTGTYSSDAPQLNGLDEADYHLLVTAYNRGSVVRIFGRLLRESDGAILWSTERTFPKPTTLEERNTPALAGQTFSPVGSPYGVIYADLLAGKTNRDPLNCIISGYEYISNKSDAGHEEARDCAEKLIAENARAPSLMAMLTFLYLDEYRENRNPRDRNPLAAAEKVALEAISMGPRSARAHQALFSVRKVQGDFAGARAMAETALRLNPYDTDIINDYAAWLISVGDYEKGRNLLQKAQQLLGSHPAWVDVYRFLGNDLDGNTVRADLIAKTFDASRSPMTAMAIAISAGRNGDVDRVRMALATIKRVDPDMLKDMRANMIKRGFTKDVADLIGTRFEAARSRAGL